VQVSLQVIIRFPLEFELGASDELLGVVLEDERATELELAKELELGMKEELLGSTLDELDGTSEELEL